MLVYPGQFWDNFPDELFLAFHVIHKTLISHTQLVTDAPLLKKKKVNSLCGLMNSSFWQEDSLTRTRRGKALAGSTNYIRIEGDNAEENKTQIERPGKVY